MPHCFVRMEHLMPATRSLSLPGCIAPAGKCSRSPHRPNPLGLQRARVLEMSPDLVRIGPIEAIDGTPVIDTKPVVGSKGLLICQRDCSRPKVDSIFVQPLSISGIVERPT